VEEGVEESGNLARRNEDVGVDEKRTNFGRVA
jgi:hypothetical protein